MNKEGIMLNAVIHTLADVDVSMIGSLIGTVGFPVALSIGLLYYLFRVQKEHKEETNQLKEAITELKLVMSQILEHIRKTDKED